jgi:hypothetical protein
MTRSPHLNHKAYSFWMFKVYPNFPKFLFCFSKFQCTGHRQIYVSGFDGRLNYVEPTISLCLHDLFLLIHICGLQHPGNRIFDAVPAYVRILSIILTPWSHSHRLLPIQLTTIIDIFNFYVRGSLHRIFKLIRSNKMQQYSGIYLLQNHCTCFGCTSHPSSSVHKTVTAATGTGLIIWATTFLQRDNVTSEEGCCPETMTCTRGCCYSFMYSWWRVRWQPETCRVMLQ